MTTAEFSVSSDSVSSNEFGPVGVVSFSAATLIGSLYCHCNGGWIAKTDAFTLNERRLWINAMMNRHTRLFLIAACVIFAAVPGCCTTYRVQVVDLITEGIVMDASALHLTSSPIPAFAVKGSYEADADGVITCSNVCSSHGLLITSKSRPGWAPVSFEPELTIDFTQHRPAAQRAFDRWIAQRREGKFYRVPLLTHNAFIESTDRVVTSEDPDDVTTVFVMGGGVNDADLEAIKQFPNVRFLSVSTTNITEEGLLTLRQFPQLLSIDLLNNPRITEAGVDQLRVALPKTIIIRSSLDQEK